MVTMSTEQCPGWDCNDDNDNNVQGGMEAKQHLSVTETSFSQVFSQMPNWKHCSKMRFSEFIPSPLPLPRQVQCQLRIGKREREQPLLLLSKHIFGPSSICHPVWGKDHSIAIWQCDRHDNYDLSRWLCLTNLFCWSSLVCYSLYFTGLTIVKPFSSSK